MVFIPAEFPIIFRIKTDIFKDGFWIHCPGKDDLKGLTAPDFPRWRKSILHSGNQLPAQQRTSHQQGDPNQDPGFPIHEVNYNRVLAERIFPDRLDQRRLVLQL
jgi:hypothetical protein